MWSQGQVRVLTPPPQDNGQDAREPESSVPLRDVFESQQWQEAVDASPLRAHHLTSMSYDAFISSQTSRVLSYRWSQKVQLDCAVQDPVGKLQEPTGKVDHFTGEVALSVLQTPVGVWTALWADALNHLNAPDGLEYSLRTMGKLYLEATVLPQYFVTGDFEAARAAMARGWMHQELAYGALDQTAVESFIGICLTRHIEQTGGRRFKGNPFYLDGPNLLGDFAGKRFRAAEVANKTGAAMVWYALAHGVEGVSDQFDVGVTEQEARVKLLDFGFELSIRQLSCSVEQNLERLEHPVLAWSVIRATANSDFYDTSDQYFATSAVIGAACGLPVTDPLADYKRRFTQQDRPCHPDGTLRYTAADLDLDVLNANQRVLAMCWRALAQPGAFQQIPNTMRGIKRGSNSQLDYTRIPAGMSTLGLGPVECDRMLDGKLRVGDGGFGFNNITVTGCDVGACHSDGGGVPISQIGRPHNAADFVPLFLGCGGH